MKKIDLIMVTTHQDDLNIFKLIDSIDSNILNVKVLLIIVSQECEIAYLPKNPLFSIIFIQECRMGLSKARNVALDYLTIKNISAEFIMFPDDDSSFDDIFFQNFKNIKESANSFIIPIFEEYSLPKKLYMGKIRPENAIVTEKEHDLIGSPNQLIRYTPNLEILKFDEKLGVGAIYGSCEDYDLFIRLNRSGEKFLFTSKLYNFHPKKTNVYKNMSFKKIVKRFKNYSSGFCFVIFKYNLKQFILMFLIRTLIASAVFFVRLNFKLSLAYLIQFFDRLLLIYKFNKVKSW